MRRNRAEAIRASALLFALPGRVRFYRRDDDGQLEFTGESLIGHTPRDETVRVFAGDAFDLVGEERIITYKVQSTWYGGQLRRIWTGDAGWTERPGFS